MRYLIFDITNLLYRTFHAHKQEDDFAGLAHHTALVTVQKYYRHFKPCEKIIMCFDRTSWRKEYTASEECVSDRPYKGTRRQKMTPKEKLKYQEFLLHLEDFENMIRDHTSIVALAGTGLEADDLIASAVETISIIDTEADPEFIIVSGDKDMMQLIAPNVRLINPADGEERTLEDWDGDSELFLFEKCVRGDASDNVQSALPRVKKVRIRKAYKDLFERANMMMQTWTNADGKEFVVKHLFEENRKLMDLRCQPDDIRLRMVRTVLDGWRNPGTFSYFHFMRFLGKYELKKLADQADKFAEMLSR